MKMAAKKTFSILLIAFAVFTTALISEFTGFDLLSYGKFFSTKVEAATEYTSGYYTYTVDENGNATIVDCDESISGNITIPSTLDGYPVISIDNYAFYDCIGVTSIVADSENTKYSSDEYGVLFNKNKTELVQYPIGNTRTSYIIPDSVTIIGCCAFARCDSLTSVTIPDGVTSIGYDAFQLCNSLTSVTIGNGVINIESNAFVGCTNLSDITIPDSVMSVGESAFDGTAFYNNASNWKDGVLYIGKCLIKAENTLIGEYTVADGTRLIADEAFFNCVDIREIVMPYGLISIGDNCFFYCHNLRSITIPVSVMYLGSNLFYYPAYCSANYMGTPEQWRKINTNESFDELDVTFDKIIFECNSDRPYYDSGICGNNLTWKLYTNEELVISGTGDMYDYGDVEYETPWNDYEIYISTLIISDGVTSICDFAFSGYRFLHSVIIGNTVEKIGNSAFSSCRSLTNATIPNSVATIGECAFEGCENLKKAMVPDSVLSIGYFAFNNTALYNDVSNWENDVLYIDNHLIKAKTSISGVYDIKYGTKTIANSAFSSCESLTSVTIPNSVVAIGKYAFEGCKNLTKATVPDSVIKIGDDAFYYCDSLSIIYFTGTPEQWSKAVSDNLYCVVIFEHNSDRPYYNSGTCGDNLTWKLYTDNELVVSGMGDMDNYEDCQNAPWFYDNENIHKVTVTDGVTSIGKRAFSLCSKLTKVAIPDSLRSIGDYAFCSCDSLESITLHDNISSIGEGAFLYTALYNEDSNWENGVLYIDNCLIDAYSPTSRDYRIKDGTLLIAYGAFDNNVLTSIAIPDSVKTICENAFDGYQLITDVYYEGTKAEWERIQIAAGNENLTGAKIHFNYVFVENGDSTGKPGVPDYDPSLNDSSMVKEPSKTTISYGDSIILRVNVNKIPEGGYVRWYPSNSNFTYSVSEDGTECTITSSANGVTNFTVLIYNTDGEIVSVDTQEITSKAGFFQKILAFFKKLFGLTKVYDE